MVQVVNLTYRFRDRGGGYAVLIKRGGGSAEISELILGELEATEDQISGVTWVYVIICNTAQCGYFEGSRGKHSGI